MQRQACNTLANLCVIQMYGKTTAACALFLNLYNTRKTALALSNGFPDWAGSLPWLYYTTEDPSAVVTSLNVPLTLTFDDSVCRMLVAVFGLLCALRDFSSLVRCLSPGESRTVTYARSCVCGPWNDS